MSGYFTRHDNFGNFAAGVEASKENIRVKEKTVNPQGQISVGSDLAGKEITAIIHVKEGDDE